MHQIAFKASGMMIEAGFFDTATSMISKAKALVLLALGLAVLFIVMKTYFSSGGNIVTTFIALLVGGLAVWGANAGINSLATQVGDDFSATGVVVEHQPKTQSSPDVWEV